MLLDCDIYMLYLRSELNTPCGYNKQKIKTALKKTHRKPKHKRD